MTEILVPLKNLRFGHEAPEAINARVFGREDDIPSLAVNLHKGQIENLVVKDSGDGVIFFVSNGNRRLAAFHMIYGKESDHIVRCTPHEVDGAGAFEQSLTTAVTARQLHPVDQYEGFARLEAQGMNQEEIARQYGLKEREVRQALALGRLSPKIRDAWRAGSIKAEVAQAFTLVPDHKAQDKLFAKLSKIDRLNVPAIREELGAKNGDSGPLVNFVGIAEYEARGGKVTRDLFKENHIVTDPVLLKIMVQEKLESECRRLVDEGWSWASIADELPSAWRHSWETVRPKLAEHFTPAEAAVAAGLSARRMELDNDEDYDNYDPEIEERLDHEEAELEAIVTPRCFSEKQKKSLGCAVDVDDDGRPEIVYGVKRPAAVSKAAAEALAPTAGEAPAMKPKSPAKPLASVASADLSQALMHRLSVQLTKAAETALIRDQDLAISVLLAAFASTGYAEGLRVSIGGLGAANLDLLGGKKFAANLELAQAMKPADRQQLLVLVAGAALDFQSHNSSVDFLKGNAAVICEAIKSSSMNSALRGAFDATDYFESAPKALAIAAIKEALGADVARQQDKKQKADIAKFATANVPATGWLPPQLRPKGYDGPPKAKGAAAAKPPAPAKKASVKKPAPAKPKKAAAAAKKSPAKKSKR